MHRPSIIERGPCLGPIIDVPMAVHWRTVGSPKDLSLLRKAIEHHLISVIISIKTKQEELFCFNKARQTL